MTRNDTGADARDTCVRFDGDDDLRMRFLEIFEVGEHL